MNVSRCLITGVWFLDPVQERIIKGDLHQVAIVILVVNSIGCEWVYNMDIPPGSMAIQCPVFYEKGKQLVFPLELCRFNVEANAYINQTVKHSEIILPGDLH